jgi:hypothetical protein
MNTEPENNNENKEPDINNNNNKEPEPEINNNNNTKAPENTLSIFSKKMAEFIFAANDFYVFCKTEFNRIRTEYATVGFICDMATVAYSGVCSCLCIIAKQTLCVRTEPLFQNTWNKIGYIYGSHMSFNLNVFLDTNLYANIQNDVYIEDHLDDSEIQKLNNPDFMANVSRCLFIRKTAYGERIVRHIYTDTISNTSNFDAILDIVPVKTDARLLLVYLQFEDNPANTFDINIPIEEYYVGNEILSREYIASHMEHQWLWNCYNHEWRNDYVVRIMDSDLNIFEISNDEYIRFENNGIIVCGTEDCTDSETDSKEVDEKETDDQETDKKEVRTVSLDSDAEMLMLFSATAANEEKLD